MNEEPPPGGALDLAEKARALEELQEKLRAFCDKYLAGDPGETEPPPPFVPCCPKCGGDLISGHVEIHGRSRGFMSIGFSYQDAWFVPSSGRKQVAIPNEEKRKACRCVGCGTIVVAGGPARLR